MTPAPAHPRAWYAATLRALSALESAPPLAALCPGLGCRRRKARAAQLGREPMRRVVCFQQTPQGVVWAPGITHDRGPASGGSSPFTTPPGTTGNVAHISAVTV